MRVVREGMKRPASNEGRRKDDDVGRALFSRAEGTFVTGTRVCGFENFEFKTQERNNI